jgi:pimeloyl-ACP methyl ester carboxylesterase
MKHLILLRGLAREAAHWLDFPDLLQHALGDDYQLHLVDFPGCGKYFREDALTTVAAMTDHARHEIDVATIRARNEAIYIVGISMGGMVALDWAQRYPDELRGLVLINSSAGNQPLSWRLQPSAWLRMIHALIASSNEREAAVLSLVSNNRDDYPLHIKQWRNIQLQRPVTRKTILTMLRAAARFHPHHECTVAGLVIASEQDRMVSVRASNDIARQFNWPIIHHPSAGHDLPMDNPQWLAGKIAQWIRR